MASHGELQVKIPYHKFRSPTVLPDDMPNGLAIESIILQDDIKEDYFRSPKIHVPAPWLFNSPELFVLFHREERDFRYIFEDDVLGDKFFHTVQSKGFKGFEEFLESCYPSLQKIPSTYNAYEKLAERRNENSGAWDELLKRDPKKFYDEIRPKLLDYALYLDRKVAVDEQEIIEQRYSNTNDEINELVNRIIIRPLNTAPMKYRSIFRYIIKNDCLDPKVNTIFRELLEDFDPSKGFMSQLGKSIKKNGFNELSNEYKDIMWVGRRVYIASQAEKIRPLPVIGRFASHPGKRNWVTWIGSGLGWTEEYNPDWLLAELQSEITTPRIRINEEIVRNKLNFSDIYNIRKRNEKYFNVDWRQRYNRGYNKAEKKYLNSFINYLANVTEQVKIDRSPTLDVSRGFTPKDIPHFLCIGLSTASIATHFFGLNPFENSSWLFFTSVAPAAGSAAYLASKTSIIPRIKSKKLLHKMSSGIEYVPAELKPKDFV